MAKPSWASSEATRRSMKGNRGRDTSPELAVRRLLHAAGLRYRLHRSPVPGLRRTADITFPRERIAIFIDGCYWHGCPDHYTAPSTNSDFWRAKVQRNRERDADTTLRFEDDGWTVLRYWTHQPPAAVFESIRSAVRSNRSRNAMQSPGAPRTQGQALSPGVRSRGPSGRQSFER